METRAVSPATSFRPTKNFCLFPQLVLHCRKSPRSLLHRLPETCFPPPASQRRLLPAQPFGARRSASPNRAVPPERMFLSLRRHPAEAASCTALWRKEERISEPCRSPGGDVSIPTEKRAHLVRMRRERRRQGRAGCSRSVIF